MSLSLSLRLRETCQRSNRLVSPLCRGNGENTVFALGGGGGGIFGSSMLGKVLLHYGPHWCLVHSYGPPAFLTPFVFLLLHRLVTCHPFSVKLSSSGTGCLLLPSLLLSLLFAQRFDATLSRICSAMVSLSSLLSFFSLAHFYLYFCVYVPTTSFVPCFLLLLFLCVVVVVVSLFQRKGPRLASCYWPILF